MLKKTWAQRIQCIVCVWSDACFQVRAFQLVNFDQNVFLMFDSVSSHVASIKRVKNAITTKRTLFSVPDKQWCSRWCWQKLYYSIDKNGPLGHYTANQHKRILSPQSSQLFFWKSQTTSFMNSVEEAFSANHNRYNGLKVAPVASCSLSFRKSFLIV